MYLVFSFLVPVVFSLAGVFILFLVCFIFLFFSVLLWGVLVFLLSKSFGSFSRSSFGNSSGGFGSNRFFSTSTSKTVSSFFINFYSNENVSFDVILPLLQSLGTIDLLIWRITQFNDSNIFSLDVCFKFKRGLSVSSYVPLFCSLFDSFEGFKLQQASSKEWHLLRGRSISSGMGESWGHIGASPSQLAYFSRPFVNTTEIHFPNN